MQLRHKGDKYMKLNFIVTIFFILLVSIGVDTIYLHHEYAVITANQRVIDDLLHDYRQQLNRQESSTKELSNKIESIEEKMQQNYLTLDNKINKILDILIDKSNYAKR